MLINIKEKMQEDRHTCYSDKEIFSSAAPVTDPLLFDSILHSLHDAWNMEVCAFCK